jgi:hypothetical protein
MRSPREPSSRERRRGRRAFLKLLAAGSMAVAAGSVPVPAATAAARRDPRRGAHPPSAKARAEIENQKRYVARALEILRAYPLPPGSDPAFVFVPLEPAARGTTTRAPERAKSR